MFSKDSFSQKNYRNHFTDNCFVCVLSHFSHIQLFVTLWTCSQPDSSVHGILWARILNQLACPSPGDLPNPGTEPTSLTSPALARGFFTTSTTWEDQVSYLCYIIAKSRWILLQPPCNSPGKNIAVGCHFLLQHYPSINEYTT